MDAGDWAATIIAVLALVLAGFVFYRTESREKARDFRERERDVRAEAPQWASEIEAAERGHGYVLSLRHIGGAAPVRTTVELRGAPVHLGFVASQAGEGDAQVPECGPSGSPSHAGDFGEISLGITQRRKFASGVMPNHMTAIVHARRGDDYWPVFVDVKLPDQATILRAANLYR